MMIERRSTDVDANPAARTLRIRNLADLERREGVFRGETNSAHCEHRFRVPSRHIADDAMRLRSSCHD
jgi:hypothetical protein